MTTQTIPILPMATYPPASRTFGPVTVPIGVTSALLLLDTTNMNAPGDPDATVANIALELSQDGGTSYLPWGGAGIPRRPGNDPKTGLPRTGVVVSLPNAANAARRLRGSVVSTEDITTAVSVQLESP